MCWSVQKYAHILAIIRIPSHLKLSKWILEKGKGKLLVFFIKLEPNSSGATAAPAALCVISMILVSLENVKKCALGGCTIISKTKINVFWNFFSLLWRLCGRSIWNFFQKTLILAFEVNSAFSCENETKIVKITHIAGP